MKNLIIILAVLLAAASSWGAGPIWPGLYGHGTDWKIADAPGTGDPVLCVIDDLTAGGSAVGSLNADYNSTGQGVYEGNLQYCLDLLSEDGSGNSNGKIIAQAINGTIYDSGGGFLYMENCDWTMIDFNPPGLTGDGMLLKNIKLVGLDSDVTLTHLFIKDLRGMHGSGRNASDGSPGNETSSGMSNRKTMILWTSSSGLTYDNVVIYKSTFAWGLDGPLGFGTTTQADFSNFTIADSIIALPIAYNKYEEWDSGEAGGYDKYARVSYSPDSTNSYYESTKNANSDTPTADASNASWIQIENDMTDQTVDAWKGLTSASIDGYSVVRNVFAHLGQRQPLLGNIGIGNCDNNIIYNGRSLGTFLYSSDTTEDDYFKMSLIGNLSIGGPNSASQCDEWFPNLWVYKAGWYRGAVLESNTSNSSSTATSLCDTSKDWSNDEWNGYAIRLVDGTGSGTQTDYGYITATNGTTECVTISSAWSTNPDASTDYEIVDLSDHDLYIADNTMIECDSVPCASNFTTRSQTADLTNPYDWDYVDNRAELPESMLKHTTAATGSLVSGYTPLDDTSVEATLLAQDGSGAGAYNANQDSITAAIFSDVANRTNTALAAVGTYKPTYILDAWYPTITVTTARTLDIPTDMWDLCDDGNYKIVFWMQNDGSTAACTAGASTGGGAAFW